MAPSKFNWFAVLFPVAAWSWSTCSVDLYGQDQPLVEAQLGTAESVDEGPSAALAFERVFRSGNGWKPIPLKECRNIQPLTERLWSKKDVLTDFKRFRTKDQVGAIVIIKTEFCCDDSRLCAATTACMEKKSTPLIGRFRVYGGWILNHANDESGSRAQWDQKVIDEYEFIQGPGARIVVMVPTFDGKMYQWFSTATELELSYSDLENRNGHTPKLHEFLAEAVKHAPRETTSVKTSDK